MVPLSLGKKFECENNHSQLWDINVFCHPVAYPLPADASACVDSYPAYKGCICEKQLEKTIGPIACPLFRLVGFLHQSRALESPQETIILVRYVMHHWHVVMHVAQTQ